MNPTLKSVLIKIAKNAVNAALVALTPIFQDPKDYNLTSRVGLEHVGLLVLGAIASRELLVWVPVILKWSQTNGVTLMFMKSLVLILLVVSLTATAQTAPAPPKTPDPLETGWNVMVGGNYMNATNAATNNGFLTTQGLRVGQHWVARSDQYITLNPGAVLVLAEAEYREDLAHLIKVTQFAVNTDKIEIFANAGAGTARSSATAANGTSSLSAAKFAWGVGAGFDIKLTDKTSIRPLDIKYVRASILQNGGQFLGNHIEFAAGLNLRF